MADVGKFLEFQYQEIEVLDEAEGISLVQDRLSGRIFQKRIISCEEGDVLRM